MGMFASPAVIDVGAEMAALPVGSVGSWALLKPTANAANSPGGMRAGSGLEWASVPGGSTTGQSSGNPVGTWRLCGYQTNNRNFSVWQRVA